MTSPLPDLGLSLDPPSRHITVPGSVVTTTETTTTHTTWAARCPRCGAEWRGDDRDAVVAAVQQCKHPEEAA